MNQKDFGGYTATTLKAGKLAATVTDLGGNAISVCYGGKELTLGYQTAAEYLSGGYIGCPVGRYANRIGGAAFRLNGTDYKLTANEGRNQLHGGLPGVHRLKWSEEAVSEDSIRYRLVLPDGENGFPGELTMDLEYRVTADSFELIFEGTSTRDTYFNPTTHIFWTLGTAKADELQLQIAADTYLPVDRELIPNAPPAPLTAELDFRSMRTLGSQALDHCFPVSGSPMCTIQSDALRMTVEADYPGLQVYTGDGLPGSRLPARGGIALEPEYWPDTPNHPEYPSALLPAGSTLRKHILYRFTEL